MDAAVSRAHPFHLNRLPFVTGMCRAIAATLDPESVHELCEQAVGDVRSRNRPTFRYSAIEVEIHLVNGPVQSTWIRGIVDEGAYPTGIVVVWRYRQSVEGQCDLNHLTIHVPVRCLDSQPVFAGAHPLKVEPF